MKLLSQTYAASTCMQILKAMTGFRNPSIEETGEWQNRSWNMFMTEEELQNTAAASDGFGHFLTRKQAG